VLNLRGLRGERARDKVYKVVTREGLEQVDGLSCRQAVSFHHHTRPETNYSISDKIPKVNII
jgi:hypothetical protein